MSSSKLSECAECGRPVRGHRLCVSCSAIDRNCKSCGRLFRGISRRCPTCWVIDRTCTSCGRSFRGRERRCSDCRKVSRFCEGCGREITSHTRLCLPCQSSDRSCESCGRPFWGHTRKCSSCRRATVPVEVRSVKDKAANGRHRARKVAAMIDGPVPASVYTVIVASGLCAYCGAAATTVDHVWPLGRGGPEHESNLVPACRACNQSKGSRLLTEWHRGAARVAQAITHNAAIAAEWARLTMTHEEVPA